METIIEKEPSEDFERRTVVSVYSSIASDFDRTRYSVWKCVKDFIHGLPSNFLIYEAGCGNGKNFIRPKNTHGCDNCQQFVNLCKLRGLNVKHGDVTSIPEDNDKYDATMCIAVIHHLSTRERRVKAIKELARITKIDSPILITVWAHEYNNPDDTQDRMIPWKNRDDGITYDRYYHYFKKDEIYDLCTEANVIIDNMYDECDNWIFIVKKNDK
jgi:SAM-dependent methyltransferase